MSLNIYENFSIKELNGYKINSQARYFVEIASITALEQLQKENILKKHTPLIWGQGFNTLPHEKIENLIIQPKLKGINIKKETQEYTVVEVFSGEDWPDFVKWSVQHNLGGIENLAFIYGFVGGAIRGNIGAYGQVQEEALEEVLTFNLKTNDFQTFTKADCQFSYRTSILKQNPSLLIVKATYRLSNTPTLDTSYWSTKFGSLQEEIKKFARQPFELKDIYRTLKYLRLTKFGDAKKGSFGTCGSHFLNPFVAKGRYLELKKEFEKQGRFLQFYEPDKMRYSKNDIERLNKLNLVKIPAGVLLDVLGWKNKWIGNVGTLNHAIHVVTNRQASFQEIWDYTEAMKEDVKKNFGLELEREVMVV